MHHEEEAVTNLLPAKAFEKGKSDGLKLTEPVILATKINIPRL
jgi:hypothetical protein